MRRSVSKETLAQQIRPLLGSDFDQFDDEELEKFITLTLDVFHEEVMKLAERTPYDPKLFIRV